MLEKSWAPQFRTLILDNLPMEKIRKLCCEDNGRPTKELSSVIGSLILQQMFNCSGIETCQNFLFNNLWIEALNLGSLSNKNWSICPKTFLESLPKADTKRPLEKNIGNGKRKTEREAHVDLRRQRPL
jgi:hypothetical protein